MVEHEDELINQRMTWLITINAFLFTAFFFSQKTDANDGLKAIAPYLVWTIPIIGVLISLSILVALVAAMTQLSWVAKWWDWRKALDPRNFALSPRDTDNLRHPQIAGFASGALIPHDLVITKVLPGVIIAAWIAILGALAVPLLRSVLTVPVWVLVTTVAVSAVASFVFALRFSIGGRRSA